MALIVETGSGLTNADSYVSLTDANTYHVARGSSTWTASVPSDAVKEAALIKATDFIDARYRDRWKGRKNTSAQALTWPRTGAVIDGDGSEGFVAGFGPVTNGFLISSDTIPELLKRAVSELALRSLAEELAPDVGPGAGSITQKKVGPLEVSYSESGYIPYKVWRWVDMLISPLLDGSDMSIEMKRSF